MMLFSDKHWQAKGVVEASADQSFRLIVRHFDEHILPRLQQVAPDGPGKEHAAIDASARTIRFHGNWWYGATISVQEYGDNSCLVTYKVDNIAKGMRWLAFVVHRNIPAETRRRLQDILAVVGDTLHCPTHLVP